VINDARARPPVEEDTDVSTADERGPDGTDAEGAAGARVEERPEPASGRKKQAARPADRSEEEPPSRAERPRRGLSLVPVLSLLLVLLLGAAAFLWFTRPEPSSVTTEDYVEALQAARSNVVDFTSFDHLTLDDDIEQVRRVSIGDLQEEAVAELDDRRQEITDAEAVVSTEVIDAGITRADSEEATVLLVIQTTRQTNASEQSEIVKYRIEVQMERTGGDEPRWVLTQIRGA
jgi:hypothetical protein